jgi:hypothetical protein
MATSKSGSPISSPERLAKKSKALSELLSTARMIGRLAREDFLGELHFDASLHLPGLFRIEVSRSDGGGIVTNNRFGFEGPAKYRPAEVFLADSLGASLQYARGAGQNLVIMKYVLSANDGGHYETLQDTNELEGYELRVVAALAHQLELRPDVNPPGR